MAAVLSPPGVSVRGGGRERRGGGGDEVGDALDEPVAEEAEHRGCPVELVEAAAECRARDDGAPVLADDGGAEEAGGVVGREAEDDLFDELVRDHRLRCSRAPWRSAPDSSRIRSSNGLIERLIETSSPSLKREDEGPPNRRWLGNTGSRLAWHGLTERPMSWVVEKKRARPWRCLRPATRRLRQLPSSWGQLPGPRPSSQRRNCAR
ncbi:hypothetical protein ZWY2020_018898 [Hordeum vulgare]|nr:hypothetical protein ZWY2020_018898 [Hordeum vulgare]